ncbi:MAG: hypothetical protein RLZZ383_2630, partial [Pseudomonadota bacterium]
MNNPTSVTVLLAGMAAGCTPQGAYIETVAGIGGVLTAGSDGLPARETGLYMPTAVTFSPEGRLVIDDFNNFRIRELQPDDTLKTIVGIGAHGVAEGPAAATPLENPIDLAWTPDGDLVIAELHTGRILQVDGGEIRVLAGGVGYGLGHAGDGGPGTAGLLGQVRGVATDSDGTVYISDTDNHCIRIVSPDGTLTHLAGGAEPASGYVDGEALDARFFLPERVRRLGRSLWVADTQNNAIRKINLDDGSVQTVAGTGVAGFDGDGGPATDALLAQPTSMLPEADGGLWIADSQNHRLRYVDPGGTIRTVAGTGVDEFSGDEGPPAEASFSFPADVARGPDGDLYIADLLNGAVRR